MSPVLFLMSYIQFAIMTAYVRPFTADMLLNAQQQNVGAASAAMNFGFTILGSLGMFIGSLQWFSYIGGIACTMFIFTALAFLAFVGGRKYIV